jgi:hypothetical protein
MKLRNLILILAVLIAPVIHGVYQPQADASGQTVIAQGTATLANTKLSLVAGAAFFDTSDNATFLPYIGETIQLCNTSALGQCIEGVIGNIGTGETLGGVNLITNGTFDGNSTASWTPTNCSLSGAGEFLSIIANGASYARAVQLVTTVAGQRYNFSFSHKRITTSAVAMAGTTSFGSNIWYSPILTQTDWTTLASSFTSPTASTYISFYNEVTTNELVSAYDTVTLYPVLSPSSKGFWIRAKPSSTNGDAWSVKHASFDPNSAGNFTWRIKSNTPPGKLIAGAAVTSSNVHAVIDDGNASITISGTDLSVYAGNDSGGTRTIINPHSTSAANWTINPYLIVLYDSSGRTATGVAGAVYNTTGLNLFSAPDSTTRNMKSKDDGFDVANVVRFGVYRQF